MVHLHTKFRLSRLNNLGNVFPGNHFGLKWRLFNFLLYCRVLLKVRLQIKFHFSSPNGVENDFWTVISDPIWRRF